MARPPLPLALLLAAAAALSLAWGAVVPPLQGPDEAAHTAYAQHLAETGKKPSFDGGRGRLSSELFAFYDIANLRATTGVAAARPAWSPAVQALWRDVDAARDDGSGPNAVAKNPPLYYAYEALPYLAGSGAPVATRIWLMRLANGLLFLAAVALTWLLVAELTPRLWLRVTGAATVVLHPVLAFMSGVVNPDMLLTALWAALLAAGARLVVRGPSAGRIAAVAAPALAALLVHGRGVAIVIPAVAAVLLAVHRHHPERRRALAWSAGVAGALGAVLAVGAARGLYGGELAYRNRFDPFELASLVWQFYLPKLPFMADELGPDFGFRELYVDGYLGRFGSMEVSFSGAAVTALEVLLVAGFAALVVAAVKRRRELGEPAAFLAIAALSLIALLHLASYRSLAGGSPDPLIVGRYLLPLTPLLGVGVAFVASTVGRRAGPYLAAVVLGTGIALQLGGLGLTLARFHG